MEQDSVGDRSESQDSADSSDSSVEHSQQLLNIPIDPPDYDQDQDMEEPKNPTSSAEDKEEVDSEKFSYPSPVGPSELKESNETAVKVSDTADVAQKIVQLCIRAQKKYDVYNAPTQPDVHSDSPIMHHDRDDEVEACEEVFMAESEDQNSCDIDIPASPPKMKRSTQFLHEPFVSAREMAELEADQQAGTPKTSNGKKRKEIDTNEDEEIDFGRTNDHDFDSSEDEQEKTKSEREQVESVDLDGDPDNAFLADDQGFIVDMSQMNPPMSDEEKNSIKFQVIKSKSHCNRNKTFRRKLIYSFVSGSFSRTDFEWFWHPNLRDHPVLKEMGTILHKTITQQERACESGGDHKKLFCLIKILFWSDQWIQTSLVDPNVPNWRRGRNEPKPITDLREYVDALNKSVNKVKRATVKVVKKRKISSHFHRSTSVLEGRFPSIVK